MLKFIFTVWDEHEGKFVVNITIASSIKQAARQIWKEYPDMLAVMEDCASLEQFVNYFTNMNTPLSITGVFTSNGVIMHNMTELEVFWED